MTQTLFDRLWALHRICDAGDGHDLLAVDRLILHERTGGVALKSLKSRGLPVMAPERCFAIMDHIVSYRPGRGRDEVRAPGAEGFVLETRALSKEAGVNLIDTDSHDQGIVHVVAPELGIVLPGMSVMCPDSHTCTLGALGALAWGIGSTEAEHILATGALRARKPKQMRITVNGQLSPAVTAKDLALHIIARHGAKGGRRCAIEFRGTTIGQLSMEARFTLCNMAVEFAAYTAIIAPDDVTVVYVGKRRFGPGIAHREQALAHWRGLATSADAKFDHEIAIDAADVQPQITWGTSPEQSVPLDGRIPLDADARALQYMGLKAGQPLAGLAIQGAFIGSCTNGRLSDLVLAAEQLRGRKIAPGLRAVCVPGSKQVRREAESLGLDRVFREAGFEWGEPGCALCFYAGGDTFAPGDRVISSTNRNFEGRQGPGVRTHLTNPAVVAASAVAGVISKPFQTIRSLELGHG